MKTPIPSPPGIALITGGGRGIGRAIAEKLAVEGHKVIVAGRNMENLEEVAGIIDGHAVEMDVSNRESVRGAVYAIQREHGRIDVLVANAGITDTAPFHKTSDETFEAVWRTNCAGPFQLVRELLPPMIDAGFGRVVLVASVAGLTGYPYATAYCASKHALLGMMRAVAKEIASKEGVTINAVCPGWVRTDMATQVIERIATETGRTPDKAMADLARMSPQNRLISVEEVAHVVSMLVAFDARGINGESIALDGGQLTG